MKMTTRCLGLCILVLSLSYAICAQDTRNVIEPALPAVCTVLKAQLSVGSGGIATGDEAKLDTARIQKALDNCGKGHGVELRLQAENNAFLSGPLELRNGVTLIVGKGVTLFASRDPAVYETTPGSCGVMLPVRDPAFSDPLDTHLYATFAGCRPLILADYVSGAGVMGDGVIDGRGNARMLGKNMSWWELGTITTKEHHDVPMVRYSFRLVMAHHADNFTLYRITLKNAPQFHVSYDHGDGFTVWGVKIDTPEVVDGKRTSPNTDGIDPGNGSKNVTITHSFIRVGDDNVAFTGGLTNATVSHNHFYWGHGMSIGSVITRAGVSRIRVSDLTIDGADSGIRVKSSAMRGGLVHDVVYDDVCVRDSPSPINFYTAYEQDPGVPLYPEYGPSELPEFRDITLRNVRISGGGKILFSGYSPKYRIGVNLDGVLLTDAAAKYSYTIDHADIHLGPGPVNLRTDGTDSTVSGKAGSGTLASCTDRFVPFPQN